MKKRIILCAILLAALPACETTKDAAGNPIPRPKINWAPVSFSIGWGALNATIVLPGRTSPAEPEPPLPQNPSAKAPVLYSPGSF